VALLLQRRWPEVATADSHRSLDDKREALTAVRLRMRLFPSVFGSLAPAAHVQVRVYDEATKTHTHTLWYCDPLPPELRATTSRLSAFVVLRLRWPGQEAGHRHLATNAQGALLQWWLGQVQAGAHQPCLLA
jgi:hypothetical protein